MATVYPYVLETNNDLLLSTTLPCAFCYQCTTIILKPPEWSQFTSFMLIIQCYANDTQTYHSHLIQLHIKERQYFPRNAVYLMTNNYLKLNEILQDRISGHRISSAAEY